MLHIKRIEVRPKEHGTARSSKDNIFGEELKLPLDLDYQLEKAINEIYNECKVVNITITPIFARFDIFLCPIRYTIICICE